MYPSLMSKPCCQVARSEQPRAPVGDRLVPFPPICIVAVLILALLGHGSFRLGGHRQGLPGLHELERPLAEVTCDLLARLIMGSARFPDLPSQLQGRWRMCPALLRRKAWRLLGHDPPASGLRRAPSEQAHCTCLVAPSRSRPAAAPGPASRRVPSSRAHCARLEGDQQIRADGSPPAGERSSSRRSSTLCPPGSDQRNRAGGSPPACKCSGFQRSGTRCPPGSNPAEAGRWFTPAPAACHVLGDQAHCTRLEATS